MEKIIITGAGLVGSLLSIYLARRGYRVEVYDRGCDPRQAGVMRGRSINLTLCDRGFDALDRVGVGNVVRRLTVPAYGRVIHHVNGNLSFQPYGTNHEAIYSIARADLNKVLLNFTVANYDVEFHFEEKCLGVDLAAATLRTQNTLTGDVSLVEANRIFGADGAFSAVRLQMQRLDRFNYSQQYWEQGYKELATPPVANGDWTSEKNALHMWPRHNYMLIAFPNIDGSFTCSLHMPFDGAVSFQAIKTEADLRELFDRSFPDAVEYLPDLVNDYFEGRANSMVTVRCSPWTYQDKAALIGDAAHVIYPSYGQGANAGFEDCKVLDQCIEASHGDWGAAFREYEALRIPNTDAIADLCVEHFFELRNLIDDPRFLLKKEIERTVRQMYPEKYTPLYSMITFSLMPYAEARRIDRDQREIINQIMNIPGIEQLRENGELAAVVNELMQAASEAKAKQDLSDQRSQQAYASFPPTVEA